MDAKSFGLTFQNSDLGFKVGWLDVGDQSPFKTGVQSLFKRRNASRWAIRANHDLFLLFVKRIECMKKLFLSTFFAGYELDIINKQHIDGSITLSETLSSVITNRANQFVHELFR